MATVFVGKPKNAGDRPKAGDDAKGVLVVDPAKCPPLSFDHSLIVRDYLVFKHTGKRPDPMAYISARKK